MIDKRLFAIAGAKRTLLRIGALTFLQALLIVTQVASLALAVVRGWESQPLTALLIPTTGFLVAYLGRHLIHWRKQVILDTFAIEASDALRQQFFDTLFTLGPQLIQKRGVGTMVTMAQEGIQEVETYLNLVLGKFSNMVIIVPIIWVAALVLNPSSAVILLLVVPVVLFFMAILGRAARAKADKQYKGFQQLANYFTDALRGLPTLRLLGLSRPYTHNIYEASETYRKKTLSVLSVAILSTFALDFFTTLSIATVALFLGIALIDGHMLLFPALATLILVPEFFLPLRDFASDYHATLQGKHALAAMQDVINLPKPVPSTNLTFSQWQSNSTLELSALSAHHETNEAALRGVSFEAKGYQKIGIIGVSGSGKSTLIDILGGFMAPTNEKPSITLNEQPLDHLTQPDWQRDIAYIPQKPYIFQGTIAENIAFYEPEASSKDILNAATHAGLKTFIGGLPKGLETTIGEGSRALSGGQAQRVALARAFLCRDKHILLFDEPTAHLDIETELELKETILPLLDGHLVFFATHRLHWLDSMDYVLVLDHGALIAQGTPKELRGTSGPHQALLAHMEGTSW